MNKFLRIAASVAACGLSTLAMAQESDSIFKSLDKNEDGLLVASEVSETQMRFFERLLRAGDKNEDGKLSQAEYQATLKEDERPAAQPKGKGPGASRPGGGQFDPGAVFDRLDSNKDGKLEKSELPEQARDRMGKLFDQLGKDAVTKEEFSKAVAARMRGGRPEGSPPNGAKRPDGAKRPGGADFFKQLDKNKDGKISKDEIPEKMRERMSGLFERLGKDEISLDELAKMRQQRGEGKPRGERPERGGKRPEMKKGTREQGDRSRPEGGRSREGRPGMSGPGGRGGPAFMRVLDENQDGRISKGEALQIEKLFDELDHNNDGELDGPELMGFPGREGDGDQKGRGRKGMERRPDGGRPEGDRPRDGRPEAKRPESDKPKTDRPKGERGKGGFGPEAFLARFDKNKDGSISKDEAPERMAENFEKLDENKDGKLTAEEFGKVFRRGGPGGEKGRRPGGDRKRPEGDRPQRPEAE